MSYYNDKNEKLTQKKIREYLKNPKCYKIYFDNNIRYFKYYDHWYISHPYNPTRSLGEPKLTAKYIIDQIVDADDPFVRNIDRVKTITFITSTNQTLGKYIYVNTRKNA